MNNSESSVIRILLIDDDRDDFILFREHLENHLFYDDSQERSFSIDWVATFDEALEAFDRNEYEVYFIDNDLGIRSGIELLPEATARGVEAPLIILTGWEDPQAELTAARTGAADFLGKQYINGLLIQRSIRYALERKRSELSLKHANARMEDLVQERTKELIQVNRALEESNKSLRSEIEERVQAQAELHQMKNELEWLVETRTDQLQQANERLQSTNRQLAAVLDQLEAERARLSAIIVNAPGAIVVSDRQGQVLYANPAANELLGPIQAISIDIQQGAGPRICYPDGRGYDLADLPLTRASLAGEMTENLELVIVRNDGGKRNVLVSTAPILDRNQRINGAIALYQDITTRKQEQARAQENATRVEVQRQLMENREKERLFLAQELHDGPVQDLLVSTFMLSELREAIRSGVYDHVDERLADLQSGIQREIHQLRNFAGELRPPPALTFGLEKAMRSYCERFAEKFPDVQVLLNLATDDQLLQEGPRLAMFRIFQELLNNVARHSNAKLADVKFLLEEDRAILEVQDRGSGFEVPEDWLETLRSGHYGLAGVRERAFAVGGDVEIISHLGQGTRVRVEVPIEVERAPRDQVGGLA